MPPLPQCSGAWSGGELNKNMYIPKYFYNLSKEEQAAWMTAKKEKRKYYFAKWCAENREKMEASKAKYYAKNPDKVKARSAKWRAENPDKEKAAKVKYRAKNLEKIHARDAKYRAGNPEKIKEMNKKSWIRKRSEKTAMKFFQMTQALSEIANINTEKK